MISPNQLLITTKAIFTKKNDTEDFARKENNTKNPKFDKWDLLSLGTCSVNLRKRQQ